ncbi:MAG: hypothetical protein ACFFBP_18490 [Promethearchaeota archaeon]
MQVQVLSRALERSCHLVRLRITGFHQRNVGSNPTRSILKIHIG